MSAYEDISAQILSQIMKDLEKYVEQAGKSIVNEKEPVLEKTAVGNVLKESREKWLGNIHQNGKLNDYFSSYDSYAMWEMIRKATCLICKERYIRHLSSDKEDFANYAADKIFQTIYDLAVEYKTLSEKGD